MTELSDRFDPEPDKPYGYCVECDPRLEFETHEAAYEHMHQTHAAAVAASKSGAASGHGIRITNPERSRRIAQEVDSAVESGVQQIIEDLARLTDGRRDYSKNDGSRLPPDATRQEIMEALRLADPDLSEAWSDYLSEEDEDDEDDE